MTNFSNQDLRDRSFRGHVLNGANFSNSDLRGCDFSFAQLVGANFEQVKTGLTLKQLLLPLISMITVGLIVADAVSRLIFGTLGQTPNTPAWTYVLVLCGVLGGASVGLLIWTIAPKLPIGKRMAILSAACAWATVGFFQAGNRADHHPQVAIVGAIISAVLSIGISRWWQKTTIAIVMLTAATISTYGFAFLVGSAAIAYLSVQQWGEGLSLGALSLIAIGVTVKAIRAISNVMLGAIGTSFRGANVTDASFKGANLANTDFTGAVGYIDREPTAR